MSLRLSAAERLFYFDLLSQLTPDARALFEARVAELLLVIADPGEGDVDRAVRAAFEACGWIPPPDGVERTAPCWTRKLRSEFSQWRGRGWTDVVSGKSTSGHG